MPSAAFEDVLDLVREAGTSHLSAMNVAQVLGLQYQTWLSWRKCTATRYGPTRSRHGCSPRCAT